jgi:hypothetical protein
MAEPSAQLNEQSDDPGIGQEVVVAPVVTQVVDVAPAIDEATGISVNTGHLFLSAAL